LEIFRGLFGFVIDYGCQRVFIFTYNYLPNTIVLLAQPTGTLQLAQPTGTLQLAQPTVTLQLAQPTGTLQLAHATGTAECRSTNVLDWHTQLAQQNDVVRMY